MSVSVYTSILLDAHVRVLCQFLFDSVEVSQVQNIGQLNYQNRCQATESALHNMIIDQLTKTLKINRISGVCLMSVSLLMSVNAI